MSFAKGCRKPDPEKLARHPKAGDHPETSHRLRLHATGAAPLPSAHAISAKRPRTDQGRSGSCTWGSWSIALLVACAMQGIDLPFVPSQRCGYADTRAYERGVLAPAGALPNLTDSGADLEDLFEVTATIGVRPMLVEQTPDGRFYDLWTSDDVAGLEGVPPANVNDEPDLADVESAESTRFAFDVAGDTIDPASPNFSDLMAATLAADVPIAACGFVDTAFEQLGAGDVAQAPNESDPNGGGHAYWYSAYRTNAAGRREFFLENSWGDSWASSGGVWVSEAFVRKSWAMYQVRPKPIAAGKAVA